MGNSKSKTGRSADEADGGVVDADIVENEEPVAESLSAEEDAKLQKQVTKCLKSMKKSPGNVSKQRKNLGKLRLYCNASPAKANRSIHHILSQQGQTLIEQAMQSHKKMAVLQNHACRVVALLARADAKATISALPMILQAMKTHKRNVNLLCNALSALSFWGMAKDTSEGEDQLTDAQVYGLAIQVVEERTYPAIFQVMMSAWHESNPMLQEKALKTLIILTNTCKECRTAFVSALAWRAMGTCLKNFASKPKMQLKGIKVLKNVAIDHPSPVSKRLEMVLTAMRMHPEDAPIQRAGCALMLLLATNHPPSHATLMKAGGGRDAVLAAMQQHASNEDIQKTSILCLQKLPNYQPPEQHPNSDAHTNSNTTSSAQPPQPNPTDTFDAITQGLEAMIQTLLKEETTAQSCTNICKALIKLAVESHTNKLDIANANGVAGIVQAMKRHPQEASLQRYGCQALGQLASVEATKRAIVHDAQGIPVVADAIAHHFESTYLVALHGILVLVRLSQVMDNHRALLQAPVVPALVQAMNFYVDHKALQHKGLLVLNKLAASRYTRAKLPMVQAGSLQAILQAMTHHPDDAGMQKMGCQCLHNLHHISTSRAVVQAGSFQVIVASMEQHGDRIGMQLIGLRTIMEITQFSCHLHYWAIEVRGLQHLVVVLQNHKDHAILQEMAFGILMRSASTPKLRQPLVNAGAIPVVMKGMKIHHPTHPFIQQTGFKTLYQLTQNSIHHGAIIFRKGGWRVVRHAQMACPDDPILQKHGWTLLAKLLLMFLLHWTIWVMYHLFHHVAVV